MELLDFTAANDARDVEAADEIRSEMAQKCNSMVEEMGVGITGYAFVVWDKDGNLRSAYNASRGLIGPAIMPTLVSDALNRHVAVMLAQVEAEKRR